jgi:DNA-binding beta-propeller fold protein YncE
MMRPGSLLSAIRHAFIPAGIVLATGANAQLATPNFVPNPYTTVAGIWAPLPDGRVWGATSTVYNAGNGRIWVAERCGDNTNCLDTPDIDPVMLIDTADGRILQSFGRGLIVWPHGIHVDADGNVWIADARGDESRMMGHQVHKFSADGELLMSLGRAGVAGNDEYSFDQPCDVLVAPNGDIFIADGHSEMGNNRIVKYDRNGRFLLQFGTAGAIPHPGRVGRRAPRAG